jgi:hypothetical protein
MGRFAILDMACHAPGLTFRHELPVIPAVAVREVQRDVARF